MARAYETGSPADFHVWRKHVKYLRHQMEVLAGVGTDDVAVLTVDLERIGEALGTDNDLTDLATTATDRQELRDQSRLLELIATKRDDIEAELKSVAAQVYEASPRSFLRHVALSPA